MQTPSPRCMPMVCSPVADQVASPAADCDDRLHVWGCGTPRTLRVYWALHELGLDFTAHPVRTRTSDMDAADFLAVSPGRKIPGLSHGRFTLVESGAIVDYLYRLAGADIAEPQLAAAVARWTCFALTELDATALYVLRRHEGLPEIYGEAPAACASARAYFDRQITEVARALADGRRYIAGDAFSPADIILVTCCRWASWCEIALPAQVDDYVARLTARDAFARAQRDNRAGA